MLKLENISKFYEGKKIIEDINLEVSKGELYSILGTSGSGKTTILKIIAGLIPPSSGRILLDGFDVTNLSAECRNIPYIFQTPLLFPHMNVKENIAFGLQVKKIEKNTIHKKVDNLLQILKIGDLGNRMPKEISGGQQQRVSIARALAVESKLLLMDEPFSSLDPILRADMGVLIQEIQQETGVSIIFVTHDRNESFNLSNKISLLSEGRFLQSGLPIDIYERPFNKDVALFMGNANFVPGIIKNNIFTSSIGSIQVSKELDGNVDLMIRPIDLIFDKNKKDYKIHSVKKNLKNNTYIVNNGKIQLKVETLASENLLVGESIGVVFPQQNFHFLRVQ